MTTTEFLKLLKTKKQTVISILILFFLLAGVFTFAQPLKYESENKVLIVQNFSAGADPYVISRSNEYLSNVFVKVIESNLFYNDVLNSGFNIDESYFSSKNKKKEMKNWEKTVETKAINDSGIIEIKVYHSDKKQLEQISRAVEYVLKTKHKNYHGLSDNVVIKTIDSPTFSMWPTKPNILLNFSLAFIFALIISFSYIYLFPEQEYDIRLWPKKSKKDNVDRVSKQKEDTKTKEEVTQNVEVVSDLVENKDTTEKHKSFNNNNNFNGNIKNIFGHSNLDK